VGAAKARRETRVAQQEKLTKGKAALLLLLAAVGAIASASQLHGWHVYVGLAIAGTGIFIGFLRFNRRNEE
jgi:hypothetical protein